MRHLLGAAAGVTLMLLGARGLLADDAPMTQAQMQAYVGLLFTDRQRLQLELDRSRVREEDMRLERDAAVAKATAVDEYWKRWTGVR